MRSGPTSANKLVLGDALAIPDVVPDGAVELAYLDPPYNVGVVHGARVEPGQLRARARATSGPSAYTDAWPSTAAYISWLDPRVRAVHQSLSTDGTMVLHLDHRAVHEAKVMCDGIFGAGSFLGEIIWLPGNGSRARSRLGITHQTLLLFARGKTPVWNGKDPALREPYAETARAMHFTHVDDAGRRFRERVHGERIYRYYEDEGRAMGSVWSDIPAMGANTPFSREATGYPTQKPLKLLERLIVAMSRRGALVLDPFFGSGTTLVAASSKGRRFVGFDKGALAFDTARARLQASAIPYEAVVLEEDRASGSVRA